MSRSQESIGLGYVGCMVNIKYLGKRTGFELESMGHQRTLEIAHTALAFKDALMQNVECRRAQAVNASGDIPALPGGIQETGYLPVVGSSHIERTLIVYIIGHGHATVGFALQEMADVTGELFLAEYGVDCCQAERPVSEMGSQLGKTVHGAWRALHHEAHIVSQSLLLQLPEMLLREWVERIDDYHDFLGSVCPEYADEAVYHGLTSHTDQGFG